MSRCKFMMIFLLDESAANQEVKEVSFIVFYFYYPSKWIGFIVNLGFLIF